MRQKKSPTSTRNGNRAFAFSSSTDTYKLILIDQWLCCKSLIYREIIMIRTCDKCHKGFLADKPWAKLCSSCFKATMQKMQCEYCGNSFWTESHRPEIWPCKSCKDDLLIHLISKPSVVLRQPSLSKDLLKDLIFLTHPDKHGNSKKATRATQQLLEMRNQEVTVWVQKLFKRLFIQFFTPHYKGSYELAPKKLQSTIYS